MRFHILYLCFFLISFIITGFIIILSISNRKLKRTILKLKKENENLLRLKYSLEKTNDKFKKLISEDPLTGILNRDEIFNLIDSELDQLKKNGNSKIAILFIDLVNFKNINDIYGHSVGDAFLILIAKLLKKSINSHGNIGRYGGDEFIILVPDVHDKNDILCVLNNIIKSISKTVIIEGQKLKIKLNIGIAVYPDNGNTIYELIDKSDKAMYMAKRKNKIFQFASN